MSGSVNACRDWNSSKRPGKARPTIISYRPLIVIFFSGRPLVPEFLLKAMLAHVLLLFQPSTPSSPFTMASSKSQASKGVDKRKREKVDQEDLSHKKKRRQKQQDKQDETPRASPKRKAAAPVVEEQQGSGEDSTFNDLFTKHKPRNQSNGDNSKAKALQKWRISEPMGGRMSDIDPIFSADEK